MLTYLEITIPSQFYLLMYGYDNTTRYKTNQKQKKNDYTIASQHHIKENIKTQEI